MYTQLQVAIKRRFGVPFAGVKFRLNLVRRLVVVEAVWQRPYWAIRAEGRFVLYVGAIDGPVFRHRALPYPSFDVGHLLERCHAITALLDLAVEIRDYELLPPQDC